VQFWEALAFVRANAQRADRMDMRLHLAAGCTANHLATFVTAVAVGRKPDRHITCSLGPYGDVVAALGVPEARDAHVALVVVEWPDLDPRLGLRRYVLAGGEVASDILNTAKARLDMLAEAITRQTFSTPVVLSLPTLPLLPVFGVPGRQSGPSEIGLRRRVFSFAEQCLRVPGVSIVSIDKLECSSPISERRATTGELGADMPYGQTHLSALAEALVDVALPPPPLKGLITDLDDTLWRGVIGEIGADGVSWHLDAQSHIHAVYQGLLAGLADEGVLIAVASKNDPSVVTKAFERADLRIKQEILYPIEVSWGPKSLAVERILSRWNIGPDAIAFVDDSPVEVAEVKARFPQVTGFVFAPMDESAALATITQIRDLFGRTKVSADDKIRAASVRRSAEAAKGSPAETDVASEGFLQGLRAQLAFSFTIGPEDERPLELINKTNQFNANGRRIDAADWKRHLRDTDRFAVAINYTDKFGPLGTISVVAGRVEDSQIVLTSWVLSCRAFARRIEHATLVALSDRFRLSDFKLDFAPTEKNAPFQAFLTSLDAIHESDHVLLPNPVAKIPPVYHEREVHER
jgi:FkbH-like protein